MLSFAWALCSWKTATVKKYFHSLCLENNSFQRSILLPLTKIKIPDGMSFFLTYNRDRKDPKIPIVCLINWMVAFISNAVQNAY